MNVAISPIDLTKPKGIYNNGIDAVSWEYAVLYEVHLKSTQISILGMKEFSLMNICIGLTERSDTPKIIYWTRPLIPGCLYYMWEEGSSSSTRKGPSSIDYNSKPVGTMAL